MVKFNLKKKVAKALVFAMVMGTVGVHGLSLKSPMPVMADEGDNEEGDENQNDPKALALKINYTDYTAEITAGSTDNYVFLEVLKGEAANAKISATYVYTVNPGDGLVVDLSFLNPKKVQYIRIYGDKTGEKDAEPTVINAQPTKEAVKYVAGKEEAYKSFTVGGSELTEANVDLYEYKTLYGKEWDVLSGWVPETSSVAGTTLIIRKAAVDSDPTKPTVTPAPAGPEVKVKVPASPKAPKVAVDYIKDTITLPKGGEFRLITGEKDEKGNWTDVPSSGNKLSVVDLVKATDSTMTDDDAKAKAEAGFTIVARTKATSKKAASNLTFVDILPQPKFTQPAETAKELKDDGIKGSVTWEVKADSKGDKSTATFTVKDASFDFKVGEGKWKTVKAGGTYVVKNVTTSGTTVLIRRTGIKPDKEGEGASPASNEVTVTVKAEAKEETPSGGGNGGTNPPTTDGEDKTPEGGDE